jgi:hypothetical protein
MHFSKREFQLQVRVGVLPVTKSTSRDVTANLNSHLTAPAAPKGMAAKA